jgi:HEPN domain-containing protein
MSEPSLAHTLLELAHRDQRAFFTLATDPSMHDSLCGFHAQQAVEKALKAVLAHVGVAHRRTHDIAELLDLVSDSDLPAPPFADRLDELNPYAVDYRYGLIEPGGLDRAETERVLAGVLDWAGDFVRSAARQGGSAENE